MTDAGFFRGTSAEQDNRFSDKQKKLLKSMKFNEQVSKKVDISKVNLDTIKPWIASKLHEMLGIDDDVLVEFVFNQLEADKYPDARMIQINLTGFLNGKNAREFVTELWGLLLSAQENIGGIPAPMLEQKKEEIKKRQEEQERIQLSLKKMEEKELKHSPSSKSPSPVRKKESLSSHSKDKDEGRSGRRWGSSHNNSGRRHSPSPRPRRSPSPRPKRSVSPRSRKSPSPRRKRRYRSRSASPSNAALSSAQSNIADHGASSLGQKVSPSPHRGSPSARKGSSPARRPSRSPLPRRQSRSPPRRLSRSPPPRGRHMSPRRQSRSPQRSRPSHHSTKDPLSRSPKRSLPADKSVKKKGRSSSDSSSGSFSSEGPHSKQKYKKTDARREPPSEIAPKPDSIQAKRHYRSHDAKDSESDSESGSSGSRHDPKKRGGDKEKKKIRRKRSSSGSSSSSSSSSPSPPNRSIRDRDSSPRRRRRGSSPWKSPSRRGGGPPRRGGSPPRRGGNSPPRRGSSPRRASPFRRRNYRSPVTNRGSLPRRSFSPDRDRRSHQNWGANDNYRGGGERERSFDRDRGIKYRERELEIRFRESIREKDGKRSPPSRVSPGRDRPPRRNDSSPYSDRRGSDGKGRKSFSPRRSKGASKSPINVKKRSPIIPSPVNASRSSSSSSDSSSSSLERKKNASQKATKRRASESPSGQSKKKKAESESSDTDSGRKLKKKDKMSKGNESKPDTKIIKDAVKIDPDETLRIRRDGFEDNAFKLKDELKDKRVKTESAGSDDSEGDGSKKKKKKHKKHKHKKNKKKKSKKKERKGSGDEHEVVASPLETDLGNHNLEELEKKLRERALKSMTKAALRGEGEMPGQEIAN